MKTRKDGAVRRQLSTLFNIGAVRELTDGQLLERFSTGPGEVAELAFEALVERHGAMVLRVCRAHLADPHDTEDAFQATFLILVKKARNLWVRDSLGPWLHQVAFRTASCARSNASRRRRHEQRVAEMAATFHSSENETSSELERVLHEEINRLPECYRVPIVLCDLEAFTCEEAARRMGCPVGTVKSWRFRGRQRLRDRLIRLGLAPSAVLGATIAPDGARAAVSEEIVRNAMRALSEWMTAGEVSASVRILVKGVLKTMIIGKLRMTAAALFAVVFLTAGLGAVAWGVADDSKGAGGAAQSQGPRPALVGQPQPLPHFLEEQAENWSLSLPAAIRIGLDLSEMLRVVSRGENGTTYKIAPLSADADTERFKSELMAHVRSIEQLYWNLSLAREQLWASNQAVTLAEGIHKREQARFERGRDNLSGVAEAAHRLEQFNLDLVTRTSDVITTERQLRKVMGLPVADHRRIIPVTAPNVALVDPDWEESLAIMLEKQPDVVRQKSLVKRTESDVSADGPARQERARAFLQQVIKQTTHSLARFFLEIDANYKQFETASRLRHSSTLLLESQKTRFKHGSITIDRLLDSVAQYATAVATEAQYKTSYNISLVAIEEAKGTLLEHEQITVVASSGPDSVAGRDRAVARAAQSTPAVVPPPTPADPPTPTALQPAEPTAIPAKEAGSTTAAAGKTVSFQFTVGIGSKPVEIRGSFTITPLPSVDAPKSP